MDRLPIIYIRGYAGSTAGIDAQVDDPFYGFNKGATHVRVDGDGKPRYYQFEGPLLRLMTDEHYRLYVHGDQDAYLKQAKLDALEPNSLWVYRFYDQAATTFAEPAHEGLAQRLLAKLPLQHVTQALRSVTPGFDIHTAALGLYDLVERVLEKTKNADRVILVAHSMGGLIARSMMQQVCLTDNEYGEPRRPAKDLVAKFFTYGTPHGGIAFRRGAGVLNSLEDHWGPAGSDIFAPEKMYGYLTPDKEFGDEPQRGDDFDPQDLKGALDLDDIFCLIGTDAQDYSNVQHVVGPKSDGLVLIDKAYVRGANRAFVYKSHSGSYGEVNSEEGYQNLRRFLFGRWKVKLDVDGLPEQVPVPPGEDRPWIWQADVQLSVRGLPIILSQQKAEHYCPIQLNEELANLAQKYPDADTPDRPVPFMTTFLYDPMTQSVRPGEIEDEATRKKRARYTMRISVNHLVEDQDHDFLFTDHSEQIPDWQDELIVDVAANSEGTGLVAWVAWNKQVEGSPAQWDPITDGLRENESSPLQVVNDGSPLICRVELPAAAKELAIFAPDAYLSMTITDRMPTAAG